MVRLFRRFALIVTAAAASLGLSGCLISNISANSAGGVTTLQATATLQQASPCTVDTASQTTTCTPRMQIALPGASQVFNFLIRLAGYAAPVTLYDPLIVQVPASMSNFSGSIAVGPPGVAPGTPLSIISGVTSVPIDASTNLVAEPGMQLVIIDFQAPASAPFGTYTLNLQFSGTTNAIKVVFATKLTSGAQTYYTPVFPCVTNFANVTPITFPVNYAALVPILLSTQGCNGTTYNFAGTAAPPVALNQQGLTGSWYEPATSGQGFEVEVFPNFVSPGVGLTQVSWFTFDTVAGGPDRQRWYTLSGNVHDGQPTASLTIYRNTGGNFNGPPMTNGVPVGTATLGFDSCTGGQLNYTFTDGSGRSGTIPLTRLTANATCSTTSARPTNPDTALSGNWYDAATSGQGFTVDVSPGSATFFVAWYTYAPGGAAAGAAGQRWYTGSGTFASGMRSAGMTLYETTGGTFDSTAGTSNSVPIGTGTMTFHSCSSATLAFTFTGGSSSGANGSIALTRIGPVPAGCVF